VYTVAIANDNQSKTNKCFKRINSGVLLPKIQNQNIRNPNFIQIPGNSPMRFDKLFLYYGFANIIPQFFGNPVFEPPPPTPLPPTPTIYPEM